MKKIVVGVPVALLSAVVLLIVWANLAPEEDVAAEKNSEEVASEGNAEDYIETAWNHWSNGAIDEENIEKETTFIALRSIDRSEMKALGMEKEFAELQKTANIISGGYGRLTEEEKQVHYKDFEDKLYEIHNSLN
ncbi:hypothetical protein [Planomicrobium sp. CPCC 101079]|uniref:hypothetical protein n=1 Tax=Planomicrobium sp. CPCC 101079 TaxID=2599618 RepID=UPI0011B6D748|nr:hypothetical protein [Planomicrobium sp. CPCC 101079]TWT13160.1 hypothetical protein FQV28_03205 [Planomicrobium sp. CPCC 101079]